MNTTDFKSKFLAKGWKDEVLTDLPDFSLYKGVECILSYKNKVSIQYHPEQGYIRLLVSGMHETLTTDKKGFIKTAMMEDTIGIQLVYGNNLIATIDKIIENQDSIKIEDYFGIVNKFKSVSDASILALEQFLDQEEYFRSMEEPNDEETDMQDQISELFNQKQFQKAQTILLSYMKNNGSLNIYLYNCILYTCTSSNVTHPSPEDQSMIIASGVAYMDSISSLDDDQETNIFFISRLTLLMIWANRFTDSIVATQKYRSLGGQFNSDLYLNYSSSACDVDDIEIQKAVLEESIYAFENQTHLFSKQDTSYLYMADNIAALSAAAGEKDTLLKFLKIAKENDREFMKNKTNEDYQKYWNDPDFLALFS